MARDGGGYVESWGEIAKISVVLAVSAIFIVFISKDAVKALKRRAHWIPGDSLVLTALTIQLLNQLSGHGALVEEALNNPSPFTANILKSDFWMIHSSQVMLCVAIAYLVPGMAARGFEDAWGKMAALVITILAHITSEVYTIHQARSTLTGYLYIWPQSNEANHIVYVVIACIVSMSFLMLVLLMGCATIAGKGIQGIISQKIPLILSTPTPDECSSCWRTVEEEVMRAWIVARAYNPEYIIARSVLSSSVAAIVTVQIVASIARWYIEGPSVVIYDLFAGTVLQQVFICIGWAIIGWRWATAVGYYTRWQSDNWHSSFQIEDFWTRHIREMQEALQPHLTEEKKLEKNVNKLIAKEPFTLANKCMRKLLSFILSKHETAAFKDYSKYTKTLEGVEMLRETPQSLWIANRKSIAEAKNLITQGHDDAENKCEDLIAFLAEKRTPELLGISCLYPNKSQRGLKYLCNQHRAQSISGVEMQSLDIEKHFADVTKTSWKMTAVSLLTIIVKLSPICAEDNDEACSVSHAFPPKLVKDCLEAYSQAWEIVDFVDDTEIGRDQIISEAADKQFRRLKTKLKKGSLPSNNFRHATPKCVSTALNELAEEYEKQTEPSGGVNIASAVFGSLGVKNKKEDDDLHSDNWGRVGGNDSIDWKAAATGNAIYKICKSIDCSPTTNVRELVEEIESSLADIIYDCIIQAKARHRKY
ncbi:hypothetical protein SUGI_0195010 [Cryptomeria japonica]|nr:hypothetical protein SUGI_0195010 [Cryptomeria japonica]